MLIEGIGNEVTHFFIFVTIVFVLSVAWATTDIPHHWNMRTVYLIERHILRQHRLTNHMESATISESRDPVEGTSQEEVTSSSTCPVSQEPETPGGKEEKAAGSGSSSTSEDEEQTEIVRAMDGDDADGLRRRRLAFFESGGQVFESVAENVSATTNESSSSANQNSESTLNYHSDSSAEPPSTSDHAPGPNDITIKLKYINDDLKVVNGRLEEQLGDFKRRHFEDELSANKLVRLIFNGQVLQRDSDTLQSYGIFHNCVVHCLVHQDRSANGQFSQNESGDNSNNNNTVQRDWDLGNLFIATVSFSLGTAWYFRYQYPQLFTVTATVGLVTITGIFTVISIGSYFPDQRQVRNRQQAERI